MSNPESSLWNQSAVLTVAEMRAAEYFAAAHGTGFDAMMLAAGRAVAEVVQRRFAPCPTLVLAGPGNNGGDGFLAAEALRLAGWPVRVAAMEAVAPSCEAAVARAVWRGPSVPFAPQALDGAGLVIDALFGTGLTRPIGGDAAVMITALNKSGLPVLAVDLPSGVETDTGFAFTPAVRAVATVTFFRKKAAHLLLPGALLCGETELAAIGVPDTVFESISPTLAENTEQLWTSFLPRLKQDGHKYDRGCVLIRGGAVMTGAARLAARAAQRAGAGLVTLSVPPDPYAIYATALESCIVTKDPGGQWGQAVADPRVNALLIGPGLGLDQGGRDLVLAALATRKPCVLDADALSLFAGDPDVLLRALHQDCILTPHEGEFTRLFGTSPDDKLTRATKAAARAGGVVLIKGADTVIVAPSGLRLVNRNAPPWLATAGAGDVLAGIILGLLAQGVGAFHAAAAGVALHGKVAARFGMGLIAEDLLDGLPPLLHEIFGA